MLCLDLPTKSVATSSIWVPFLVDHWKVEGVGGTLQTGFCKGLLRCPAASSSHKGGRGKAVHWVSALLCPVIRQSNTLAPTQLKTTMPLDSFLICLNSILSWKHHQISFWNKAVAILSQSSQLEVWNAWQQATTYFGLRGIISLSYRGCKNHLGFMLV